MGTWMGRKKPQTPTVPNQLVGEFHMQWLSPGALSLAPSPEVSFAATQPKLCVPNWTSPVDVPRDVGSGTYHRLDVHARIICMATMFA